MSEGGVGAWWRVAVMAAAAIALGACSLGEQQDIADRASAAREADAEPRIAVVSLALKPRDVPEGIASESMASLAGGGVYAVGVGTVEPSAGRWSMLAPPEIAARIAALTGVAPTEPAALLFSDRETTVVRRPARDVVAARAWYRLEHDRAREVTKPDVITALTGRNPSDLAILTPTLMVDLLAGVLAGSVEQRDNVVTGRLSVDKANREDDLDDDAIESRGYALRLFAVTDDVHDFTLTLTPDGSIDELQIDMVMKPDKQTRVDLSWSMDVQDPGPTLAAPPFEESVRISSFNQARGAVAAWGTA